MAAIWTALLMAAGKSLASMLFSLATKEFFTNFFLWAAEKGVKSTKTTWDDELFKDVKAAVEKANKK